MPNPYSYLKKNDPMLGAVIRRAGSLKLTNQRSNKSAFYALANAIIYQQLSGKAAGTIFKRFLALVDGKLTPDRVIKLTAARMRTAGVSKQKFTYLHDLALHFVEKKINPKSFKAMTDDEVIAHLTDVKGIGEWTAQMFLMFHLGREDVFAPNDLGLHKGICEIYRKKYPLKEVQLLKIANKWKPYRSYASLYLWHVKDTVTPK